MEIRFFMIFTQIRKRKMIQIKGIQDYFSLKERPEQKRHVKTWQEHVCGACQAPQHQRRQGGGGQFLQHSEDPEPVPGGLLHLVRQR